MTANISQAPLNTAMSMPLLTNYAPASKPSDTNQQLLHIIQQLVSDLGSNGAQTPGQAADGLAAPGGAPVGGQSGAQGHLANVVADLIKALLPQSGAATQAAGSPDGAAGAKSPSQGAGAGDTAALANAASSLAQALSASQGGAEHSSQLTQQLEKVISDLAQALQQQDGSGQNGALEKAVGQLAQALSGQGGTGGPSGGASAAGGPGVGNHVDSQLANIISQLVQALQQQGGGGQANALENVIAELAQALAQQSGAASAKGAGDAGGAGGNAITQQLTHAISDLAKAIGQQPGSAAGTQDLTQAVAALAQALAQKPAGAAAANGPGTAGTEGAGTNSQLAQIIGELAQALQGQMAGGAGQAMGGPSNGGTAGAGEPGNAAGPGGIAGGATPSMDPVSAAAQQLAQAMQSQGDTPQGMTSPIPTAIGQLAQTLSAQTGANQGVTENQIVQGLASAMNPGMGDNGSGAMPPAVTNAVQQVLANLAGQGAPTASSQAAMPSLGGADQAMGGLSNGGTAGAGELGNAAGPDGIAGGAMPSMDPISAAAQQLAQAMQSQGETPQGMTSPVPTAIGQLAQTLSAQTGANQGVTENQIVQGLASAMNPGMGDNGSGAMPPAVTNAVQQVLANLAGQGAPTASQAAMPSPGGAGGAGGMDAPNETGGLSGNGPPAGGASNPLMNAVNELMQVLEARMGQQTAANNPLASAVADLSKALAA